MSQNWFQITDGKGLIVDWLTSENEQSSRHGRRTMFDFIRNTQVTGPLNSLSLRRRRTANGLSGGQSYVIQRATFENSRRFFDLFLNLINDGTLDNAVGPIAVNSTFWSMMYGLDKTRPDWIVEVTAHWLQRCLSIIRAAQDDTGEPNWNDLFNHDDIWTRTYTRYSATKAPEEFAQHVLPVILKIADEAVYGEIPTAPKRDAVWGILINGDNISIREDMQECSRYSSREAC